MMILDWRYPVDLCVLQRVSGCKKPHMYLVARLPEQTNISVFISKYRHTSTNYFILYKGQNCFCFIDLKKMFWQY